MNCNTQNAKIASITERTLIVGIDVGSETHYARAFDWRNYEYTKKPLEFSNTEAGFLTFKAWMEDIAQQQGKTAVIPGMETTGHYWFALGKFLQDNPTSAFAGGHPETWCRRCKQNMEERKAERGWNEEGTDPGISRRAQRWK